MKTVKSLVLAAAVSAASLTAFARPGDDRDFRRPGRSCEVNFKKCDFAIGGACVKWNNKSFRIDPRDARWACNRARQEYGRVKDCYVRCN